MATKRWSQRVTRTSDALTLDEGVFKRKPAQIARSLKRSAERSRRRKSTPFRSAMSMLTFYENRAGRTLSPRRRRILEAAKDELRKLYDKPAPARRKSASKTARRRKSTSDRRGKASAKKRRSRPRT